MDTKTYSEVVTSLTPEDVKIISMFQTGGAEAAEWLRGNLTTKTSPYVYTLIASSSSTLVHNAFIRHEVTKKLVKRLNKDVIAAIESIVQWANINTLTVLVRENILPTEILFKIISTIESLPDEKINRDTKNWLYSLIMKTAENGDIISYLYGLSNTEEDDIDRIVASNSHTPSAMLEDFVNNHHKDLVWMSAVDNSNYPIEKAVELLISDPKKYSFVMGRISKHEEASELTFRVLVGLGVLEPGTPLPYTITKEYLQGHINELNTLTDIKDGV